MPGLTDRAERLGGRLGFPVEGFLVDPERLPDMPTQSAQVLGFLEGTDHLPIPCVQTFEPIEQAVPPGVRWFGGRSGGQYGVPADRVLPRGAGRWREDRVTLSLQKLSQAS